MARFIGPFSIPPLGPRELVNRPHPASLHFSVVSGSNHALLFECLDSLFATLPPGLGKVTVTVTCNQPGSDLSGRLRAVYQDIDIVENQQRRGFSANHNSVARRTQADYLWIINDDLVFLPGAIERLTSFMQAAAHARVAAASPRLLNPDRTLQPSTYSFPVMPQMVLGATGLRNTWLVDRFYRLIARLRPREGGSRFWAHDRTVDTETFRGACVAMRMSAVREVGPMVEVSLVGGEETEWHRRIRRAGWRIAFFSEAEVIHYGNQTIGADRRLAHEELKGILYYFASDRPAALFALFCAALVPAYAAQLVWRTFKGDREGRRLAADCLATSWRALWGDWPGRAAQQDNPGAGRMEIAP